jgi:hypothetical protein
MRSSWWPKGFEPLRSRLFAARVLAFAGVAPLLLRGRGLRRLPFWLEPRRRRALPPTPEEVAALVERIDALLVAGRPLVRSGCLTRGLTLYRFLRREGAEVSLRFGVGTIRGEFAAHCWIVYGEEPLAEIHDPRPLFSETWRIGPAEAAP